MISIIIAILLYCTIFPLCIFLRIALKKKLTENYLDNLNLLQTIKECRKNWNAENSDKLIYALISASYLALLDKDILKTEQSKEYKYTAEEGSSFKVRHISDNQGHIFLPVFTDWNHIKGFTNEDVNGLMFSAKELFSLFQGIENTYSGIVINPAKENFIIEKENIDMLYTKIISDKCLDEVLNLVKTKYRYNNDSIKSEDLIFIMGNITGYFIYKVIQEQNTKNNENISFEQETVFATEEINNLIQEVCTRIQNLLEWYGFDFSRIKVEETIYKLNLKHKDSLEVILSAVVDIYKKYEFDNLKSVDICALGTAIILENFYETVPISKALGIAFSGIIEGSKKVTS